MEPMTIPIDTVLRVFPNPERFKTCYVEDWDERIKKVDRDFVVVDKPPLLPCFAHVTNGKEVLHRCLADALRVRTVQEVELGMDDRNMTAMTHIDEEVSGLVILARHEKARLVCEHWLKDDKCVFEFVAICTKNLEKGVYRHFYMKTEVQAGNKTPTLYDNIPKRAIRKRSDYEDWNIVTMEVVASAELDGGYAAMRIRTE
ncbi:RNA pseudouridine synthase 6, partial [Durusdinium trenchii]